MLQPRQQYGLGSFVKKAVKGVTGAVKSVASGIKSLASSDVGKLALLAGGAYGLNKFGLGAIKPGFLSNFPGASAIGEYLGTKGGKTLLMAGAGTLLGGVLSRAEQGDPEAMQVTRDVGALRNYLTSGYTNLGYSSEEIPALVEKDVSEYSSIGGYANGGRIGFANGVTPELMKRINAIIKEIESKPEVKEEEKKPSKLQEQIKKDLEKRHMQDIVVMEKKAYGGRIGYAGGGRDETPEEKMFREMKNAKVQAAIKLAGEKNIGIGKAMAITNSDDFNLRTGKYEGSDETIKRMLNMKAYGGRIGYMAGTPEGNAIQASGVMGLPLNQNKAGVTELDLRNSGGFIPPVGVKEKADDIPAMLSNNEFVFTADAVRGMGNGDVNKGAQRMYDMMKKLEKGGRV
jgi:hypothetical protein